MHPDDRIWLGLFWGFVLSAPLWAVIYLLLSFL